MIMKFFPHFFCLLLLSLSACSGKIGDSCDLPFADLRLYPQNLHAYTRAAGGTKLLLSPCEQAAAAERQKEAWYQPWQLDIPAHWIEQFLDRDFNLSLADAYTNNYQPFSPDVWDALVINSNKMAYGKEAGPAITLRGTNLRAMPSDKHFFQQPDLPGEGYPFDYFQHTSIPPGTPIYICNVSKDRQWMLVDSPLTAGWAPARDVARVDAAFIERWQSRPLAAIVRDGTAVGSVSADIGALLPLAMDAAPGRRRALRVYYPVRGASGQADMLRATLAPGAATAVPLPLTARAVAEVGSPMLGQAYGWGGLSGHRDCSALTRDLFTPFGIYLPRHSASQAQAGRVIELGGLPTAEKEALIVEQAAPFRSLIWLRGHIGVYIGAYKGRAMLFHNMWGLRIKDADGGCDNRAIVGKGVITTLQPGIERPDLCHPGSFLDRIEIVTILPQ
jgi:cell wall-associated NlpC family hydrolase